MWDDNTDVHAAKNGLDAAAEKGWSPPLQGPLKHNTDLVQIHNYVVIKYTLVPQGPRARVQLISLY